VDTPGSSALPALGDAQSPVPALVMDGSIHFKWLHTGIEAFQSMFAAIRSATTRIRFETYIYVADSVGEEVRAALIEACYRGVKVQVLVDALGSFNLPRSFWEPFVHAGGEFAFFNPFAKTRWSYRDHRKLLVCDDVVAFIGGFNIAEHYRGDGVTHGWRDLGLQVTGTMVKQLAESFDTFFGQASDRPRPFQRLRRGQNRNREGLNWRLVLSGPGLRHGEFKRSLGKDLKTARSVQIVCAYFLPTWRLRKALIRVAQRGGQVQLILAGKTDVMISQLASHRLYRRFLRAGVQIYEYQPQILHSKLFIVDDQVYAGSANLDTRSLWINYELVVRIKDSLLANQARAIFETDLQHSIPIDLAAWGKSRSFWMKLKESWAYFVLARVDPYMARRQRHSFE
jgi:cardiolipin synthase A/B